MAYPLQIFYSYTRAGPADDCKLLLNHLAERFVPDSYYSINVLSNIKIFMKTPKYYYRGVVSLLFIFTVLLSACKREASVSPDLKVAGMNGSVSDADPCATCQVEDLYKTVGSNEVVGSVKVCQTTTDLFVTFTVSDALDAWFNKTRVLIDPDGSGFTSLNPGLTPTVDHEGKLRSFTYTIPFNTMIKTDSTSVVAGDNICIAAGAVVPGPDGGGGMVWAGQVPPSGSGNPNPRSFCYVVKSCNTPPPPTVDCFFTQGYWFAKPNVQWPGATAALGGNSYTYLEARAIFFGSNAKTGKTDAKQAFLQGLSYQLNKDGGAIGNDATDEAFTTINAYFTGRAKVTPTNINKNYPSSDAIRAAAGVLSDHFNANHCGDIY
jgi:hypothetical protein